MNQAQEIIIYRSPAEKAIWDALMESTITPYLFVIAMSCVAGVIAYAFAEFIIQAIESARRRRFTTRETMSRFFAWGVAIITAIMMTVAL